MLTDVLMRRYLGVLGLKEEPPTSEFLSKIVAAHLMRVPFENISKLWLSRTQGATTIPDLEDFLDGINLWNFGGTCYANNYHLFTLLRSLGFDITLCGADMSEPDVHIVSMVTLQGREYLVDVGYGAPFFVPLPRDLECAHIIDFGRCRYILHPQDNNGCSELEMQRDGSRTHGYLAKPESRVIEDFAEVIEDSYRPNAGFMNALVIERFTLEGSVRLHNMKLTETAADGTSTSSELSDLEDVIDRIERHFEIPSEVTRQALEGVNFETDIYG